jgi:hypothetical protein
MSESWWSRGREKVDVARSRGKENVVHHWNNLIRRIRCQTGFAVLQV